MFVIQKTGDDSRMVRLSTRNTLVSPLRSPHGTFRWLIDPDGTAQIFTARRKQRKLVFGQDGNSWRELASFDSGGPEGFVPRLFVDGRLYVTATHGNDTSAIYRYDLDRKALMPTALISAPGFDADGYFLVDHKKMTGYRFTTDAEATVWFDETMKTAQREIDQAMPATLNSISRGSRSETPYILVDSYSDLRDHSYSLYNRDTKMALLLVKPNPAIDPQRMAPMSLVRYKARDGLEIPAYVTLPNGGEQKAPTVVLVGNLSWSGITDLNAMFANKWRHIADHGADDMLARLVGDPATDAARFKQTSPLANAARIKQPVLLAYGKDDQVVPFAHGLKFYEALRAGNPNVEWLAYTPTVDDWKTQRNRIDLWQHIDAFLAKNIGGK